MNTHPHEQPWDEVLQFWFPEGRFAAIASNAHREHWLWRMRGGADGEVIARFSDMTAQAAAGNLDHWATDPEGRLALIILLDQFSRSVWRGTPRAFAQDPAALELSLEGLANGHYAALPTPWFKIIHGLPLGHCEGGSPCMHQPPHRAARGVAAEAPEPLQPIYQSLVYGHET